MNRRIAGIVCGRRMKWGVVAFWIVVTVALGFTFGTKISDEENNEYSSWLPASAESTEALEQSTVFQSENTLRTTVIYERAGGLTDADLDKVNADHEEFSTYDGQTLAEIVGKDVPDGDTAVLFDGEILGPIVSKDGEAVQIQLPIDAGENGWLLMPDLVDQMRDVAATDANGMATHVAGQGGNAADQADAFANIDGLLLVAALCVVITILLFTYRSPILWLFPVICAVFAMLNAQGVIYLLSKYGDVTVNAQSIGILTVLVLGAGTDYALLLVARYREELRRHHDRHEAMAEALRRAGPAVIASASTVIAGMLCLLVADMNSTAGMGPVLAIGVAVVLLAMISLLPALLVIMGRWIFWPVRPTEGSHEPTSTGLWAKTGWAISHRPRTVWIGTAIALGALCLGTLGLNANGLTAEQQFTGTPDSVKGDRVVEEHFASDASNPLQVMTNESAADTVAATVADVQGVDPDSVAPLGTQDGKTMIQAGLTDPALSDSAYATVDRVREAVHTVPGADALVGGNSAINWDIQQAQKHDNKLVIPLTLAVVFLILILLLRAFIAPLLLVATVVLSFGAALGFSALVFEHVFDMSASDSSLPLFVFVFLVALGIDYNIFLTKAYVRSSHLAFSR